MVQTSRKSGSSLALYPCRQIFFNAFYRDLSGRTESELATIAMTQRLSHVGRGWIKLV